MHLIRWLFAILMALAIHRCNTKHIARWRTSWATLEAIGRCHRATICTVLPRRPPGSSILAHTTKVVAAKTAPRLAAKKAQNGPSTHVIDAASFVKLWHCTIGAEELSYFSSFYQTEQRTQIGKLTKQLRSLSKSGRPWQSLAVKPLIHSKEQYFSSALFLIDHNIVV